MEEAQAIAYTLTADELAEELDTDVDAGLTEQDVETRREKFGFNELEEDEKTPIWKLILEQFDDLLVKILLGSAVLSFVIAIAQGEGGAEAFVEPAVILLILIINAAVGVWQESNAENALEALKQLQPRLAVVIRGGQTNHQCPARELVPGDVVELSVGDKVPADIRLTHLHTTTLRSDESALTGESRTVLKQIEELDVDVTDKLRISQKVNMLFSGTTVTGGKGRGIVVYTGMKTAIGNIQEEVSSSEDEKTPLKEKLDEFGELLAKVIGIICILVWVMNYNQFWDAQHGGVFNGCIYYLKIAVALGVAAIPEGLPAVITLCLALGTRRMTKKNAIIRHLPSVETLGCTTVICSDKTGTLTLNEMTAVSLVYVGDSPSDLVECAVEGTSYNPSGRVVGMEGLSSREDQGLVDFQACLTVCNDAKIIFDTAENKFVRHGEPTEAALKVLAEKMGIPDGNRGRPNAAMPVSEYYAQVLQRQATLEFSRGRKSMSVLAKPTSRKGASNILFVKGAPEGILNRCTRVRTRDGRTVGMSAKVREQLMDTVSDMARRPLRVLALASKEMAGPLKDYNGPHHHAHQALQVNPDEFVHIENYLVFHGLVGIKDPARPEVKQSIQKCKEAGIRVIMITGDNQETAEAIAVEIGILEADDNIEDKSFTGKDFMNLTQDERMAALFDEPGGRVFSRTDPKDKKDIVELLKARGEVAAMTGDGVNDAPALKAASIGIAMGIAGTAVAKESSKMILADDNFATIVSAIEEGRAIYSNMKAFIRYLISSNIGEVASIFLTSLLGFPEGLVPVQLLWVNLVTDGPPATALGFNPSDPDCMKKKPRAQDDQLINQWVFFRYMVVGLYVGFATVGIFAYWYMFYESPDGHTLVTWSQLANWGKCNVTDVAVAQDWGNFTVAGPIDGISFLEDPCSYFKTGKKRASTLSLTVLVLIEMLNALNALSEDSSLLEVPPWANPWLLAAIVASVSVHLVILYIPALAAIFSIVPLTGQDWLLVWYFSAPVILVDEVLKWVGRNILHTNR